VSNADLDPVMPRLARGVSARRQVVSAAVAVVLLVGCTAVLQGVRGDVSITIVFLIYLAMVVALSAAGGPLVGVSVAIVAFLVVNFFFTEPLHTLNVADPERLAELIIFLAVSGTVATLVDTASRRRDVIEEQTAEAATLTAANELRTALLRAVSHDLRTPLTTAKMATSSLLASDVTLPESARHELLELADAEIDRLVRIVENLLDAGRLQAGVLSVDLRHVDLDELVERVIAGIDPSQSARVRSDLLDSTVVADAALLERVLVNLVSNALTADPTGTITITARDHVEPDPDSSDTRSRIELDVIDHGPGLSEEQRADAFRPFHRFEDRGASTGVGLGLPICAGFCEAIGASLELHSSVGAGLTARVILERA
jgi:two-component system, OmpR family, sensor histidine kinase KdpD